MSFDPDLYLQEPPAAPAVTPAPAPAPATPPAAPQDHAAPIAIVGMAGRFPGARNIEEYWRNLREGRETITFFPESEMESPPWARLDPKDPKHVRAAGILDDADCFDAGLFGYSPREAQYMDPQQRVFLETCWAALEHAGYNPRSTGGHVGVFAGTVYSTYLWTMLGEGVLANPAERLLATIGNLEDNLTTRVAYKLNLQGPAVTVQTACSSSLVAVNLACESLLAGKCRMALAGGVAIVFPQKTGYLHNPDLIDSGDGHCRAFAKGSTGTIFSNGVGVVLLKRLADAQREGDTIHAVILGSAVNNDGNDKIGYAAPSVSGQASVIREALRRAQVHPTTVGFVEAHGTGTPLGDPIEVAALNLAYGPTPRPRNSCPVGSVKSNIGHLNTAAGVAGLIKAVLALKHREIPPTLHWTEPNPEVPFAEGPFYVNASLQPWSRGTAPRRAAVSSFGIGGTNAHLVLEEAPAAEAGPRTTTPRSHVVVLSARSRELLQVQIEQLADWLGAEGNGPDLGDLASTLALGRSHFSHRFACVAASRPDLRARLVAARDGGPPHPSYALSDRNPPTRALPAPPPPSGPEREAANAESLSAHLGEVAHAYVQGAEIDWTKYFAPGVHRRMALPTYPFARERHWFQAGGRAPGPAPTAHPFLAGERLSDNEATFTCVWHEADALLRDHRVKGVPTVPGVVQLEWVRAAAARWLGRPVHALRDVRWLRPLQAGAEPLAARLELVRRNGRIEYLILQPTAAAPHKIAQGEVVEGGPGDPAGISSILPGAEAALRAKDHHALAPLDNFRTADPGFPAMEELRDGTPARAGSDLYQRFRELGLEYGPTLSVLRRIWVRNDQALGELALGTHDERLEWTPSALDAMLQVTAALMEPAGPPAEPVFHLPFEIDAVEATESLAGLSWVRARRSAAAAGAPGTRFVTELLDAQSHVLLRFRGLASRPWKPAAAGGSPPPAPVPPLAGPASQDAIERQLRRQVAASLRVPETDIDPEQSFAEFGVDSILAVEIAKAINDAFQLSLRTTDLFNYSSVRKLAQHLAEQLKERQPPAALIPAGSPPLPEPSVENGPPAPAAEAPAGDDIAIVGMAGRFPDAADVGQFWENLRSARDSVREIPRERYPGQDFFDADPQAPNKSYSKWGGTLDRVDGFDPLFFGVSPKEAELMDPQQRIFLEEAWRALDEGGFTPASLEGSRCGVYVGVGPGDYADYLTGLGLPLNGYAFTGNATSILAARIAYHLNLKGPSIAIDTACSSSLVAIHLGCQSLKSGETDMVVAGGVHVMTTPRFYVLSSKAGMLSPRGACRAFDDEADGMVPGEGAGVVVLKRLRDALRDGDHVHAVIRASGTNQDGKTNGITAPSSTSQTALELAVYAAGRINPKTITFVEAHGTGTKLGDPIELHALQDAFARHTPRQQFCALGSVKTNIGHLMTAAGIAGLVKVLLCLRHRELPPSLHFRRANSHFEFGTSAFYVNTSLRPWTSEAGHPRRAALSSFGFSGTNAHLVLEEPPAPVSLSRPPPASCWLLPFSAHSAGALQRRIADLGRWLDAAEPTLVLPDLAYTLGTRRSHGEYRLAVLAADLTDLKAQLRTLAARDLESHTWSDPKPSSAGEAAKLIAELRNSDRLSESTARALLQALASSYEQGTAVPWDKLYPASEHRLVAGLPPYPFDERRCWAGWSEAPTTAPDQARLPPPVDSTAARAGDQAVSGRRLRPDDAIIRDHQVDGHGVLPGVAWLEMLRAAAVAAAPGDTVVRLVDVVWLRPVLVGSEGSDVRVVLTPAPDGFQGELHSGPSSEPVVHARGRAVRRDCSAPSAAETAAPPGAAASPSSPDEIRRRCTHTWRHEEIYQWFSEQRLQYGASLRCLRELHWNSMEALGRLQRPPGHEDGDAVLAPGLLDSALQTTVALSMPAAQATGQARLPFCCDTIEIHGAVPTDAYVWARFSDAGKQDDSPRFDLSVLDESGGLRVRISGLCTRSASTASSRIPAQEAVAPPGDSLDLFFEPVWEASSESHPSGHDDKPAPVFIVRPAHDHGLAAALAAAHDGQEVKQVYLGRGFERLGDHLLAVDPRCDEHWDRLVGIIGPRATVYFLGGLDGAQRDLADLPSLEEAQARGVLALWRLSKALDRARLTALAWNLKVVTGNVHVVRESDREINPAYAPLIGLAKVLSREIPGLKTCAVDVWCQDLQGEAAAPVLASTARLLRSEARPATENEVGLRSGVRYLRHLRPLRLRRPARAELPVRAGGVYLLAGGAGGIGSVVAEWLAGFGTKVVLVGRRPATPPLTRRFEAMKRGGGEVAYLQGDITEPAALRAVVAATHEKFGPIRGVIHSALVLQDAVARNLDEAGFRAAFDPKVKGSFALYDAVRGEPLDFFVFFSSANSFGATAGQGNYVAGCAFKDAFGTWLRQRRGVPAHIINWGFWGEVGAVASDFYRQRLAAQGILGLTCAEGLAALECALHTPHRQVVAVKLDTATRARLGPAAAGAETAGERLQRQFTALSQGRKFWTPSSLRALETFGRERLGHVFLAMGAFPEPGAAASIHELRNRMGILPKFERLLLAFLEILCAAGFVEESGGIFRRTSKPLPDAATAAAAVRADVAIAAYLKLLTICLDEMPRILRGERKATEVLFPGGSMELIAPVYSGNPVADLFNQLLASAVREHAAELARQQPGAPVRILEIGAGTGGGSDGILRALAESGLRLEYHYTDISPQFLAFGQKRFGHHAFLRTRALDIEQDPATQGFRANDYDLVVASNVLHATRRMERSLSHVGWLLRPGGALVLNELTRTQELLTLTFGLTDGWWLFEDPALRHPYSPLLSQDRWRELLGAHGFDGISGLGDDDLGQTIILARRAETPVPAPDASLRPALPATAPAPRPAESGAAATGDDPALWERAMQYLWQIFAGVMKLDTGARDRHLAERSFERFGVDSLVTMELVTRFEKEFGRLPKTLLFEHTNLRRLTEYFLSHHGDRLRERIGWSGPRVPAGPATPAPSPVVPLPPPAEPAQALHGPAPTGAGAGPNRGRDDDPIAIIGLSGRYPGAPTLDRLWENLRKGAVSIREVPSDRWNHQEIFDPAARSPERSYSKWGGFIDDFDKFDPLFFNISPREAELLDPQERLFLETAWATFEDAGYPRSALGDAPGASAPRVGVFVGVMHGSYQLYGAEAWTRGRFVNASSGFWSIANRVSYVMDLHGPSLAVDTACSSSLTALHLACESLHRADCEMALAGGVNLVLHPLRYLQLCQMRMLSRDEKCRPFGQGASGFVVGEGVGAVLLKPLSRAIRDRDHVYAVIRGSSINSGGKTNGYTVPNPNAQAALITQALARAGVSPRTIGYVEAHGTGTALGDPIEIAGLAKAFQQDASARQFCAVGSIKSNIGHLEAAAGIASLTKVLLMLKHGQLVPSLNADEPNTAIDFPASPFRLQRELGDWAPPPAGGSTPRRAAISSFGAGGANAHVILEEYRGSRDDTAAPPRPEILVLSARNQTQLRLGARRLQEHLEREPATDLGDVAYTLQLGREALDERLAWVASSTSEAVGILAAYLAGESGPAALCQGNAASPATAALQLDDGAEDRNYVRQLGHAGRHLKIAGHWVSGSVIHWEDLHRGRPRRRVSLPSYPFARERCWIAPLETTAAPPAVPTTSLHPLVAVNESTLHEVRFARTFDPAETVVQDHRVQGQPVLPAAAQLELARAAGVLAGCGSCTHLEQIVWMRPVMVGPGGQRLSISFQPHRRGTEYQLWIGSNSARTVVSKGLISAEPAGTAPPALDLRAVQDRATSVEDGANLYPLFARLGLAYGRSFQVLEKLWRGRHEALARLRLADEWIDESRAYEVYPALLDGALQASAGLFSSSAAAAPNVPFALGRLRWFGRPPPLCYAHVVRDKPASAHGRETPLAISLVDERGDCLVQLERFVCRALRPPPAGPADQPRPNSDLGELLGRLARREVTPEEAVRLSLSAARENGATSLA